MNETMYNSISTETFEAFFNDHSDVIFRLCLYKTSNETVATDLTQEVFTRLWKVVSSGKDIEKPKQYLYQIARNIITDYYKSKKALSLDGLHEEGFDPTTPEPSADVLAEATLVRDTIELLDQEFRDVVYLRLVEEMSVKDIAELLEISENLASVRINRGKKKLKELFKEDI